jgi:hypothetical protein
MYMTFLFYSTTIYRDLGPRKAQEGDPKKISRDGCLGVDAFAILEIPKAYRLDLYRCVLIWDMDLRYAAYRLASYIL